MSSLLGKRYYESVQATAADSEEEEEDDYTSDKFLKKIEEQEKASRKSSSGGKKTYTQLRKEAQKRKEEKGYIKPRAEREKEAREQGLKRNLMMMDDNAASASTSTGIASGSTSDASGAGGEANVPPTSNNKALAMMMKMGFKPGEALGRKVEDAPVKGKGKATSVFDSQDNDDEDEDEHAPPAGIGARKIGIGAKKKVPSFFPTDDFISIDTGSDNDDEPEAAGSSTNTKPPSSNIPAHRIDPIEIQMRSGRAGLGVEESKRRKLAEAASKERKGESLDDYRLRARSNHAEKRAEGQLKSIRKTCIELDEREGDNIKWNHLWLDPMEEYHKERERAFGERSRFRIKLRDGAGRLGEEWNDDDDNEYGDDQVKQKKNGKKRDNLDEIDLESDEEVLDNEELERREQEKMKFLPLSAVERMKITLDYLRQRHHYCFWCGTAYSSAEELASECPGPEEEDH